MCGVGDWRRERDPGASRGWLTSWIACGLVMCVGVAGCSRPQVVPASPTIPMPQLLPPEPVPDLQPPVLSIPSFEEQQRSDRWSWIPDEPAKDWKYIVLHHTASSTGSVEAIHNTHLKNKDKNGRPWQGIGYHFVIGNGRGMNDGDIEPTFRWRRQMAGAHAGVNEYNQHGIGIVLVGNFEHGPPTERQLAAVNRLVTELARRYEIKTANIVGHGDVRATECPGRHFPLARVRAQVAAMDRYDVSFVRSAAIPGLNRKEPPQP